MKAFGYLLPKKSLRNHHRQLIAGLCNDFVELNPSWGNIQTNPGTTFDQLRQIFPDEIHPSFGVVALLEKATEKGGAKRYFLNEEQLLQTGDGQTIAVCNQWGIHNINPILEIAKRQGYQVEEL